MSQNFITFPRCQYPKKDGTGLCSRRALQNQYYCKQHLNIIRKNQGLPKIPTRQRLKKQQPFVQQPYVQQPFFHQPYVQQPYVQQPYVQQPYVQQPYVQQPYVQQPYFRPQRRVQQSYVQKPKIKSEKDTNPAGWCCKNRSEDNPRCKNIVAHKICSMDNRYEFDNLMTMTMKCLCGIYNNLKKEEVDKIQYSLGLLDENMEEEED